MPNVRIGSDCIIATNSIVTKDIPDGMVAGGCPAKIICTVEELAKKWLANGAQPTETVAKLLKVAGIEK